MTDFYRMRRPYVGRLGAGQPGGFSTATGVGGLEFAVDRATHRESGDFAAGSTMQDYERITEETR